MIAEPSPRPWRIDDGFECEIVDATGRHVLTASSKYAIPPLGDEREAANAALIVDAVNERDRLRSELADKARNYEDVISHHQRTEEYLRDIVRRLADLSESLLANYEYRYREDANSIAFVENTRGFLREARAAIGEDAK